MKVPKGWSCCLGESSLRAMCKRFFTGCWQVIYITFCKKNNPFWERLSLMPVDGRYAFGKANELLIGSFRDRRLGCEGTSFWQPALDQTIWRDKRIKEE